MTAKIALPLRIGARTVGRVTRKLVRVPLTLEQTLAGTAPELPPLPAGTDGYLVTSLPASAQAEIERLHPRLKPFVRQRYGRSYALLEGGFEAYLGRYSSKTRSTLKRKLRKLAEANGGALDVRTYAAPNQIEEFHRHARSVSARTYQEKLLGAGLPDGEAAIGEMRALAAQGAMRAWLLFLKGEPISYLYAPAEGSTLVYAYLGYDPDHADLSPGTVLQLEAMRELMEEGRFTLFDFTEGEGQHKQQFGTGAVDCVDLLLLRRTAGNLAAGHLLNGFDAGVALAKRAVHRLGLDRLARRIRR
jgi:CelD/BcsL family acetyltransferase involved in cellulose biosynthesis